MYWFPFVKHSDAGLKPFSNKRVMGVLQRIRICYAIGTMLIWKFSWKTLIGIGGGLLVLYWALMAFGGDYKMTTNLGHKLDVLIFGAKSFVSRGRCGF